MKVELAPGAYVLAVSGGVDSMVLLDVLAARPELKLIVAHFDHGARADSTEDRRLVQAASAAHNLAYIYDEGHLGAAASEATARTARYAFLRRVMHEQHARAIITAHHQDDVLETAILNLLRGTGRKGLSSLQSNDEIVRPLLGVPKSALLAYARAHDLRWREDSTNADDHYLRNYVRHNVVPRLGADGRVQLLAHIARARELNATIDALLDSELPASNELGSAWFVELPYDVSVEIMAAWLRRHGVSFDRRSLHRLVVAAKTLPSGKRVNISSRWWLIIDKGILRLANASQNANDSV